VKKLSFGNIVELDVVKGESNQRDICPVLVFWSNYRGTAFRNVIFTVDLEFIDAFAPTGNKHLH
jgi:hypothetical protein